MRAASLIRSVSTIWWTVGKELEKLELDPFMVFAKASDEFTGDEIESFNTLREQVSGLFS